MSMSVHGHSSPGSAASAGPGVGDEVAGISMASSDRQADPVGYGGSALVQQPGGAARTDATNLRPDI